MMFDQTFEEREDQFIQAVCNIVEQRGWPKDEAQAFTDHWTEMNAKGRKMRFEKEGTFDLARRMNTWERNYKKFNNGKELRNSQTSTADALNGLED